MYTRSCVVCAARRICVSARGILQFTYLCSLCCTRIRSAQAKAKRRCHARCEYIMFIYLKSSLNAIERREKRRGEMGAQKRAGWLVEPTTMGMMVWRAFTVRLPGHADADIKGQRQQPATTTTTTNRQRWCANSRRRRDSKTVPFVRRVPLSLYLSLYFSLVDRSHCARRAFATCIYACRSGERPTNIP